MPNTPQQVLEKAKDAESRFNTAAADLRRYRYELSRLVGTSTLTDAQKTDARRIMRKGATRRRRVT
jgi:hypothetical protein